MSWGILLGERRFKHRAPGDCQGVLADESPEKVEHAGGEEDEHPRVDDGVNGDEAEGDQVLTVILDLPDGVEVHPDL